MKKILKALVKILVFIALFIGATIAYIGFSDLPSYEVKQVEFELKSNRKIIKRGKKLSAMLCSSCHYNTKTNSLSGKRMVDAPTEFGEIYSPNITQDKKYGIGNWTAGELVYLLRTGIKKDGQYSPPYMAKLPLMADEDINAIIAFLKSNDPLVRPDPTPDQATKPSLLTKVLCRIAFKPFDMPKERIEMPDFNNDWRTGEYLVHNLECFSCHSADFKTNDYLNPKLSEGYFGGGNKPLDLQGRVKLTSNITPDKETGIGNWTKKQFIQAVKYGRKEGEAALTYPMRPYTELTDKEVSAMFEYLQSIPAIQHKVERSIYSD